MIPKLQNMKTCGSQIALRIGRHTAGNECAISIQSHFSRFNRAASMAFVTPSMTQDWPLICCCRSRVENIHRVFAAQSPNWICASSRRIYQCTADQVCDLLWHLLLCVAWLSDLPGPGIALGICHQTVGLAGFPWEFIEFADWPPYGIQ